MYPLAYLQRLKIVQILSFPVSKHKFALLVFFEV